MPDVFLQYFLNIRDGYMADEPAGTHQEDIISQSSLSDLRAPFSQHNGIPQRTVHHSGPVTE